MDKKEVKKMRLMEKQMMKKMEKNLEQNPEKKMKKDYLKMKMLNLK